MSALEVRVAGWNPKSAVAFVDGIRVRVRRREFDVLWLCDDCGKQPETPTCPHAIAFAATPAGPVLRPVRRDGKEEEEPMYTLAQLHALLVLTNPSLTIEQVIAAAASVARKTTEGQPGMAGFKAEARVTHKGAEAIATSLGITL